MTGWLCDNNRGSTAGCGRGSRRQVVTFTSSGRQ